MATRKIIVLGEEGSEVLSKKCKIVENFDAKTAQLLDDLNETLDHAQGLGLAAPQVGILKRMTVIHYDDKKYEIINPTILKTEGSNIDDEGCLSVKTTRGLVKRPNYIKVEFFDREGKKQVVEAEGYFARVFFHEIDHLDGIVFVDKILPENYKTSKKSDNKKQSKK